MAESQEDTMQEMIADLATIASTPEASLTQLSERLQAQTGFLSHLRLVKLITESIEDELQGQAVNRALQNLRPESLDRVLEAIDEWRQVDDQSREVFPDELFAGLGNRLSVLIQGYPALSRGIKASKLQNIIGNELYDATFICDARPVYNDARDQIEGMIPVTTIRLVYEQQDEEMHEIEMVLTASELRALIERAEKAEVKLKTLQRSIAGWLPDGCVDLEGE